MGLGSEKAEGCPALQHWLVHGANAGDLEKVVHDPDGVEAHLIGGADDPGEGGPDGSGAAGPGEGRELEAELHGARLAP